MSRLVKLSLLVIFSLVIILTAAIAATGTVPAPSVKDKCPVCGMLVAKFPNWMATAKFKDGATYYFDGPKDLFSYYLDTSRFTPGRSQSDIIALTVKEYYSLGMIDPRKAYFVTGSDVNGPMGHELIPFATQKDAASFKADHNGKRIIRFQDITRQLIKSLN